MGPYKMLKKKGTSHIVHKDYFTIKRKAFIKVGLVFNIFRIAS
jgi:hypothetical protein